MPQVLVVEDEPNVAFVEAYALRQAGFEVTTHTDPRAAWAWLDGQADGAVLAVVLDLWMPALSGREFLVRLRDHAAHAQVPVALVTGALPNTAHMPPAGSYQRFIPKPFDLDVLVQCVRELAGDGGGQPRAEDLPPAGRKVATGP